jgi:hypothetical protein
MYNIMENPYEEYKFHLEDNGGYAQQTDKSVIDSTVFWKFEDPWEKEPNVYGVKQYKQQNIIERLLDQKGRELAKNPSDETLSGRNKDNLFIITNDVYEKILAERKAFADEENEYKERNARATANIKAEEIRVNNLIAVGGDGYLEYIRKLWNKSILFGNDNELRLHHFKKVLQVLEKRLEAIQNNTNRVDGIQYNCVSKREILGNGFRSCKPTDFAFPKEEWLIIIDRIGDDRGIGCHPTPTFRDKRCVLVKYKHVVDAVDKEFDCLSTFGQLASKVSNVIYRRKGGKTHRKTKGKQSKRRKTNKRTMNKK